MKHGLYLKLTQHQYQIMLQQFTTSLHFHQHVRQRLAENPELEIAEGPVFPEDSVTDDPDGWVSDFAEADDEWETGEGAKREWLEDRDDLDFAAALEKAAEERCDEARACLDTAMKAIDEFRRTGLLPKSADGWLTEALATLRKSSSEPTEPAPWPTFQVTVRQNCVVAIVTASMAEQVVKTKRIRGFSDRSTLFFKLRRDRLMTLNGIAQCILADLQADFFRQPDLKSALRMLVPIPATRIPQLKLPSPIAFGKSYLSNLGKLLVESPLGVFPLSLFWPAKAALVRVWVQAAQEAGHSDAPGICDWIRQEVEKRCEAWPPTDQRHAMLSPLRAVSIQDVRNTRKKL